tara:strand:- start:614 stop:715 length:102 start_codon:yes stop_codon:yes gene_type:complete
MNSVFLAQIEAASFMAGVQPERYSVVLEIAPKV